VGFLRDLGGWHLLILLVLVLVAVGVVVLVSAIFVGTAGKGKSSQRSGADAAGPEQQGLPPSVADELAKLAALRASGALTEAEYVAAKARLLGQ